MRSNPLVLGSVIRSRPARTYIQTTFPSFWVRRSLPTVTVIVCLRSFNPICGDHGNSVPPDNFSCVFHFRNCAGEASFREDQSHRHSCGAPSMLLRLWCTNLFSLFESLFLQKPPPKRVLVQHILRSLQAL